MLLDSWVIVKEKFIIVIQLACISYSGMLLVSTTKGRI